MQPKPQCTIDVEEKGDRTFVRFSLSGIAAGVLMFATREWERFEKALNLLYDVTKYSVIEAANDNDWWLESQAIGVGSVESY